MEDRGAEPRSFSFALRTFFNTITAMKLSTSNFARHFSIIAILSLMPMNLFAQTQTQVFGDLRSKVHQAVTRPEVKRGSIGLKVVSLDTGKVWFDHNSEKYFMPASNNKSFTIATAIEKLGPDFRFVTSVYAAAAPDKNGKIKGDLTIYGRGDVSISSLFNDGDYYKGVDALAEKIVAAGVKKVEGDLVGDDSYFSDDAVPGSWEWDDLSSYYGAEVSALPVNDNAIDVSISPSKAGQPCGISLKPVNAVISVINKCTTGANDSKRTVTVQRSVENGPVTVAGSIAANDKGMLRSVAVTRPALLLVDLLKQRLREKGVTVKGAARVVTDSERASSGSRIEIAKFESAPLSVIALRTMKPSQNMFTETVLRTLGEQLGDKTDSKQTSTERGLGVIRKFLKEIGAADDGWVQWDGSGLSRHNLVTPAILTHLYTYMAKQSSFSKTWMESLPIGGVDGTIQNRFKGTAAQNNVHAKTGTIDQVSALSGYVTTAAGEKLVFSMIVNGVPDGKLRVATIDQVILALAEFNGRNE